MKKIKITFVCLGNICRSPLAEAIFKNMTTPACLSHIFQIYSAGTAGYHIGEKADPRTIQVAAKNGLDISMHLGRQFIYDATNPFHYVLAMDRKNLRDLRPQIDPTLTKLDLLLNYSITYHGLDTPDPYYGGSNGFDNVFEMIHDGCIGLLQFIRHEHNL